MSIIYTDLVHADPMLSEHSIMDVINNCRKDHSKINVRSIVPSNGNDLVAEVEWVAPNEDRLAEFLSDVYGLDLDDVRGFIRTEN